MIFATLLSLRACSAAAARSRSASPRFSGGDFIWRRLAALGRSGVFADQRLHRVGERTAAEVGFKGNGVAACVAAAAVPAVFRDDHEPVVAAANGAFAVQFGALLFQFRAVALGDFEDRDRSGLVGVRRLKTSARFRVCAPKGP
jgi:hypothetical protein